VLFSIVGTREKERERGGCAGKSYIDHQGGVVGSVSRPCEKLHGGLTIMLHVSILLELERDR